MIPLITDERAAWLLHGLIAMRAIAARGGLGRARAGAFRVEGVYGIAEEQLALTLRRAGRR